MISKQYEKKDPRIKVFRNNDVGIIPALNKSYKNSSGQFITRMDADDKMPLNKLETLLSILQGNVLGTVATGKVHYFPRNEIKKGYLAYENWLNHLCETETHWEEIYKECVIPSPCWLMHRETLDKIGAFNSGTYPEDYDLVWRMFMNDIKVLCSTEILHLWRDHPNRVSRNSEVYQTQTYFELKVDYMLQMPEINFKKWVVWGAGKKGKSLIQILQQKGKKNISWVCNNSNKIGKVISNIKLGNCYEIDNNNHETIVLITVSGHEDRTDIERFMKKNKFQKSIDYFVLA
jgi:glycosyltransferase involved in cell wall biosynthesis